MRIIAEPQRLHRPTGGEEEESHAATRADVAALANQVEELRALLLRLHNAEEVSRR
jgi:hypothetical protein